MVFDAACDQVMLFDPESGEMRPHSEGEQISTVCLVCITIVTIIGAQSCTSTPYSTPYSTHARRHDNVRVATIIKIISSLFNYYRAHQ